MNKFLFGGANLTEKLQKIYFEESQYCAVFISKEYINKFWTRHELDSVIYRSLIERIKNNPYILPIKFDDTTIPGLSPTTVYLNAIDYSPEEISKLLYTKVKNIISENYSENSIKEVYSTLIFQIENLNIFKGNRKIIITKKKTDNSCSFIFLDTTRVLYFISVSYNDRRATIDIFDTRRNPKNFTDTITAEIMYKNGNLKLLNQLFIPRIGFKEINITISDIIDIIKNKLND